MDARDAQETIEQVTERGGRYVALLISILAAMLALVEVSGGNAEQDATTNNITAANLWSFYQAKTIRRSNLQQLTEMVELDLPDLSPERAERTRKRLEAWRATAARYELSQRRTRAGRSWRRAPRPRRSPETVLSRPTTCSTTDSLASARHRSGLCFYDRDHVLYRDRDHVVGLAGGRGWPDWCHLRATRLVRPNAHPA